MKKAFMVLVLLFIVAPVLGAIIEIPPEDPKCAADEKSFCTQTCMSTLLACGPFGYWEAGIFVQNKNRDCNATICGWICICIKEVSP